jgi:hypothetical protein
MIPILSAPLNDATGCSIEGGIAFAIAVAIGGNPKASIVNPSRYFVPNSNE